MTETGQREDIIEIRDGCKAENDHNVMSSGYTSLIT